jgi:hypothetical protein
MATIQRPIKTYGNRNYVAEVNAAPANYDPVLANEVDADLDTVYAAWNGGADTVNIKDGAVTYAKLATDAKQVATAVGPNPPVGPVQGQLWWRNDPDGVLYIYYNDGTSSQFVPATPTASSLWRVSGATLTPTDATKAVAVAAASGTGSLIAGTGTSTLRLLTPGLISANYYWSGTWQRDDTSRPGWLVGANNGAGIDNFSVARDAGAGQVNLLVLDSAGSLTTAVTTIESTGTVRSKDPPGSIKTHVGVYNGSALLLGVNDWRAPEVAPWPSWLAVFDANNAVDNVQFFRRAAGAAAGSLTMMLKLDAAGNLVITGSVGQKASGTTWANPSDPRLKTDVGSYQRGLAEIIQLTPISYHLKSDPDGPLCYGFDATAVKEILPECVSTARMKLDPADETETDVLTFDMHPVLVALINAVKELNEKVQ